MAGDWLAVRLDVARDPAVLAMSQALAIPVATVVGGCVIAWAWANEQLADGNARGVTFAHLDALTGVTGLSDAMQDVGWLRVRDSGITIPSFDRWNSKSAKKRLLGARRAASSRSQKRNARVTQPALRKRHLEESRGESTTTPTPTLPASRRGRAQGASPSAPVAAVLSTIGANTPCSYCAALQAQTGRAHTVDHVVPVAAGGSDRPENLAVACYRCNQAKGSRVFADHEAARSWLHAAYWRSNRARWIEHRAIAFGGVPPNGAALSTKSEHAAAVLAWADVITGLQCARGTAPALPDRTGAAVIAAFGSCHSLRDSLDNHRITLGPARKAFLDAYAALGGDAGGQA